MRKSRREFLTDTSLGVLATLAAGRAAAANTPDVPPAPNAPISPTNVPPGTPSAFATAPPAGPVRLHEMKHMPHGARASFALVSLREDATFVGGRYDNWNCPMVRRP